MIFKFCLFWWCVIVFAIMGLYLLDQGMRKKFGPAKVLVSAERLFKEGSKGGRRAIWAQLVDPKSWSPDHPVLQSADIRMVRCDTKSNDKLNDENEKENRANDVNKPAAVAEKTDEASKSEDATAAKDADETEENESIASPSASLVPVELQPLKPALGFIMRHKVSLCGMKAGPFLCTRECTNLEDKADGDVWRMAMRTVEVGPGYAFLPGTEWSEVELHPPADDGSVRCVLTTSAEVNSRLYRWWNGLQPNSQAGAEGMLEAIETYLLSSKKKD